jgi:hypothetical protein
MLPRSSLALFLLAAVALLQTGCSPAQKIVGKWELDGTKTAASLAGSGPMAAMISAMASQMKLEVEFKGDGNWATQLTTPGISTQTKGSWRFVKAEGDTLVLAVKPTTEAAEQELKIHMVDDNNIEFVPPTTSTNPVAGKTISFRRVTKT